MTEETDADRLCALLRELSDLLESHGEDHWAASLRKDERIVAARMEAGLVHFLSTFGGMGSFNELYLHPRNGHRIDEDQVGSVNARLERLREQAYRQSEKYEAFFG